MRPNAPITPLEPTKLALTFNPPPPTAYVGPMVLSGTNAAALASEFTWSSDETQLFAKMQFLSEATFAKYINKAAVTPKTVSDTGVFAMRVRRRRSDTTRRNTTRCPPTGFASTTRYGCAGYDKTPMMTMAITGQSTRRDERLCR